VFSIMVTHILFGCLISFGALAFEEGQQRPHEKLSHVALLTLCCFWSALGYRQINSFFRLRGIRSFLKKETAWATVQRRGFAAKPAEPPGPPVARDWTGCYTVLSGNFRPSARERAS
jgi:hypothetical protein